MQRTAWRVWDSLIRIDLARARILGDERGQVDDLLELGRVRVLEGRRMESEVFLRQAKKRAETIDYKYGQGLASVQLATVFLDAREFEEAAAELGAAMVLIRATGDRPLMRAGLLKLGVALRRTGKVEDAIASWKEVLGLARAEGDAERQALALMNLGSVAYDQKRYQDADSYWIEAIPIFRKRRDWVHTAYVAFFLGVVSRHFHRPDAAVRFMNEARDLYRRIGDDDHLHQSEEYLRTLAAQGATQPASNS